MAKYVKFLYYLLLKAAIENFKTLLTEKLTDNKVILSILVATLKTFYFIQKDSATHICRAQ